MDSHQRHTHLRERQEDTAGEGEVRLLGGGLSELMEWNNGGENICEDKDSGCQDRCVHLRSINREDEGRGGSD